MSDKEQLQAIFQKIADETEIVFVPDKKEPFNLDKTMVYFIREPDPYEGLFIYKF